MHPLLQIPCRHLSKVEFFRHHHFSAATAFYSKSNLLCSNSTLFTATNSTRCFTDKILKSDFVSPLIDQLTQNDAVYAVQEKLFTLQEITGLPWWAVIVTSTIGIRTLIIFPFVIHQQRVIAKYHKIREEMETTVQNEVFKDVAQVAKQNKLDEESSDEYYEIQMHKRRMELYAKHKFKPSMALALCCVQMSVWLTMSGAIYNINSMLPIRDAVAQQAYLDWKATSIFLFTDLTVPDGTHWLAFAVIFANYSNLAFHKESFGPNRDVFRTIFVTTWTAVSIGSFLFIVLAPKCLILYWMTSSFVGYLQNILLGLPYVRKKLRISQTKALKKNRFERLKNRIKSIYYFFKY